jgi:hypothetical protein
VKRPISDEFVQSHNSPWSDEARRRMEESDGIDLMDQDVPADHEIERSGVGKAIDRRFREVDMKEPARPSPLPRNSEDLRIAIDADDRSGRTNELTGHYRNVAGATTEIKNPHSALEPRASQQTFRGSPDERRLVDQAPDLGLRMAESICCVTHVTYLPSGSEAIGGGQLVSRCAGSVVRLDR